MTTTAPASTPAHRLGGTSLPAPAEASTIPTPAALVLPEISALPGRLANAAGQGRLPESASAGAERGSVSAHRYGVSSLSIIWPGASRLPAFFDFRRA